MPAIAIGGPRSGYDGGPRPSPGGLLHIISVRPSKQPLMVRTFLKVYMELGSYFLFLQEQIKDIIIIRAPVWDYIHRRLLIAPSITHPRWNYYPLLSPAPCHLSSRLTWKSPPVECIHHTQIEQQPLDPPLPNTSPADSSEDNHSIPIIQIDDNDAGYASH